MSNELDLQQFASEIRQDVIALAEVQDEEAFREDIFTDIMIDYLLEAGEVENGVVCSHRAHGMQVNGYGVSDDQDVLSLFVTSYTSLDLQNIRKTDIETALKRTKTFLQKALTGYHAQLEEASPVFDMALRINDIAKELSRVKIYFLTDGISKLERLEDEDLKSIKISYHVWDMERLYRYWSSGRGRETIEVTLEEPIPCIQMPGNHKDYVSYLAIVPGSTLVELYEEYGSRLMERNVRSFLQARGTVNKGIRNTITKEPHMFLAYNNGLSATAEKVDLANVNGTLSISKIRDLQIVNGGQTTASIYHTAKKDKADVSEVYVQVKLTVLLDAQKMDEVVPRISEYANSQNKIQMADFSANDPFHVKVEEFSRTIWAPAKEGDQRQTRWFYERARGQFNDLKAREITPAKKKVFDNTHPSSQKFTKTDLAKYEHTWAQLPHMVSKGAQNNFQEFTVRLKERGNFSPDATYFEHLVAKGILIKNAEKLVHAQQYGGYRANIVTYSLALLSNILAMNLDLDRIWREQNTWPELDDIIVELSAIVHQHIVNAPGGGNVTEWCKKEACWKKLLEKSVTLSEEQVYSVKGNGQARKPPTGIDAPDPKDKALILEVMTVPAETWFAISAWAKETNNLQSWQRSIAFSLGKLAVSGREPSRKQATQGMAIYAEAGRLGFIKAEELA